jgi:hypothetical protein
MSIKVVGFDGGAFSQYHEDAGSSGRFIRQFLLLVFSGNYVTGGDLLDLTNAGGSPAAPNTVPPAAANGLASIDVNARGTLAATSLLFAGGTYVIVAPNLDTPLKLSNADLSTLRLKVFKNTAGSVAEYSAGAYGADVLGDVVVLECVYAR